MVERFLAYSLAHARAVRVLWADNLKFQNITVTALTEEEVTFLSARHKGLETRPISQILSAAYARGDDGDTLQYSGEKEEKEHGEN